MTLSLPVMLLIAAAAAAPSYDAELTGFPYPFPVHSFALETQRQTLRLAYMDVQPAKPNGETVVLLHGKNFCGAYWEATIRMLNEKGYRVVVPDQIGFGKSSKPERFQFTFQELADDTRRLLDSLGVSRASIVGHSMGGMIFTQPVLNEFPDLRVPVLLIVGQRDRTAIGRARAPQAVRDQMGNYPELGKHAASAIPGAKLVEIMAAGHLPQLDAFAEYRAALLQFLPRLTKE